MLDLIRFRKEHSLGFSKFYLLDDVKGRIAEAEDLADAAARFKNKKTLIMLKDHAMDDGAMKLIAEKKNACFLIDLGRLMKIRGVQRSIAISKLRNFLSLCVKHGAFYAFASFSETEGQIRSPEELEHIAMLLGINRGQAKFALRMLNHYL